MRLLSILAALALLLAPAPAAAAPPAYAVYIPFAAAVERALEPDTPFCMLAECMGGPALPY